MHPRTHCRRLFLKGVQLCGLLLVLLISVYPAFATKSDNLVLRKSVSKFNRDELTRSLRTITGWQDLTFDSNGALKIGNVWAQTGSQGARDLLTRAFAGQRVILFEDASSRKDVVFCRVGFAPGQSTSRQTYVVLIDFADFRHVIGDKQALAAFNVGWAVLHEIDHVVADSQDPEADVPGECESHINSMRREVGLPIRNSYFFSFIPIKNGGTLISRFVRLGFDQHDASSANRKRYWVIWDAAVVGGLSPDEKRTLLSEFTGLLDHRN